MYRHPDSSGSLEEWFGKNEPPEVPGAASAGREVSVCSHLSTTSILQAPRRDRRSPDAGRNIAAGMDKASRAPVIQSKPDGQQTTGATALSNRWGHRSYIEKTRLVPTCHLCSGRTASAADARLDHEMAAVESSYSVDGVGSAAEAAEKNRIGSGICSWRTMPEV